MPSVNSRQLIGELSNCYDHLLSFSGFLDLFGKAFSILNYPNFISLLSVFCESNENNTVPLVSLQSRGIIKIKLWKLNLFCFHKTFKMQGKEAGTNFILFSRSRNMIGQFTKTYLYRPIKILQLFTRRRI